MAYGDSQRRRLKRLELSEDLRLKNWQRKVERTNKDAANFEAVGRKAGQAIGMYFGGPAGAAVGNAVGGGGVDMMMSNEMNARDRSMESEFLFYKNRQKQQDLYIAFEELDREANLKHIKEPINAYTSSFDMAELMSMPEGSPGIPATSDAMNYGDWFQQGQANMPSTTQYNEYQDLITTQNPFAGRIDDYTSYVSENTTPAGPPAKGWKNMNLRERGRSSIQDSVRGRGSKETYKNVVSSMVEKFNRNKYEDMLDSKFTKTVMNQDLFDRMLGASGGDLETLKVNLKKAGKYSLLEELENAIDSRRINY